jgi:hypothetical protein
MFYVGQGIIQFLKMEGGLETGHVFLNQYPISGTFLPLFKHKD